MPARAKASRPARRSAGEEHRSARLDTYQWSTASVPAWRNTQRSRGTPARSAAATEQTMRPDPWSTWLFEHSRFGYGNEIIRLSGVGSVSSSGVNDRWIHASGFLAATSENADHSRPSRRRCSSTPRPSRARSATSNSG